MYLEQLVRLTAQYTETLAQLPAEGSVYTGEAKALFDRLAREINEAIGVVARQWCSFTQIAYLKTDKDRNIGIAQLQANLARIRSICDGSDLAQSRTNGAKLRYEIFDSQNITVYAPPFTPVIVRFDVVPSPMESEFEEPAIDEGVLSHSALCYYAASMYWASEGQVALATFWDNKWQEATRHLTGRRISIHLPQRGWY